MHLLRNYNCTLKNPGFSLFEAYFFSLLVAFVLPYRLRTSLQF